MEGARHETSLFSGSPSELIGRQIADYRIEGEIGRGGMAVVYRAKDLRLDRIVALKLLTPELASNDTFRARFTHESRVAAAIEHPNIVPIFEAGEADGILYIAMRYVPGRDLSHLLAGEGPLPLAVAVGIAVQVASALDAAHDHGLVHRDVKPGNILVSEGTDSDHPEHVYLTDFGLTKKSLAMTGFTTRGQFVGTLEYVAPEQISGKPVDGRCDVYSLAVVVYETLAGRTPFQCEDPMALLWAHQYDQPPALTVKRPDLAAGVDAVMEKALAKCPDDRYDSCTAFVNALRAAARSAIVVSGTTAQPEAEAEKAPEPPRPSPEAGPPGPPPEPPSWARPVFPG
ncbi:serine/threonine-protein kinase [Streptomyces lutosisoli]|uniref:non-specific serine/threonine protein kinase n=1 Tax=Streptomyces lutosisoli TaxID=2665721 RepID=A0ABW2VTU4_9ACTN